MTSIVLYFGLFSKLIGICGIKKRRDITMKYQLFQENTVKKAEENIKNGISIEELIEIQAQMLVDTYHAT